MIRYDFVQSTYVSLLQALLPKYYHCTDFELNYFMLPFLSNDKEYIINSFNSRGIEIGKHFSSSLKWAKNFGYTFRDCPNSERIVHKVITLPCHYNLPANSIAKICNTINRINLNEYFN